MGNGRIWLVIAFVLTLGALTAARVVSQGATPPASVANPVVPQTRQFHLIMSVVGGDKMEARRWVPSTMVVNAGDTVIVHVTNGDAGTAHGFSLPIAQVQELAIEPGDTKTFTFTVSRPGIYMFACPNAGCSSDHGDQEGQLVVLPVP